METNTNLFIFYYKIAHDTVSSNFKKVYVRVSPCRNLVASKSKNINYSPLNPMLRVLIRIVSMRQF